MKKITKEYVKGTKSYKQLTGEVSPTVPGCVAKWFEENKTDLEVSIWRYIYNFDAHEEEPTDFYDFMNSYDKNSRKLYVRKLKILRRKTNDESCSTCRTINERP
ncbi:DUF1642 domain-containing protein [Listeria monocytogenes]